MSVDGGSWRAFGEIDKEWTRGWQRIFALTTIMLLCKLEFVISTWIMLDYHFNINRKEMVNSLKGIRMNVVKPYHSQLIIFSLLQSVIAVWGSINLVRKLQGKLQELWHSFDSLIRFQRLSQSCQQEKTGRGYHVRVFLLLIYSTQGWVINLCWAAAHLICYCT